MSHMSAKYPVPTSYRLTDDCRIMIRQIAENLGISMSAVIEIAVRQLAQEGLDAKVIQVSPLPERETD